MEVALNHTRKTLSFGVKYLQNLNSFMLRATQLISNFTYVKKFRQGIFWCLKPGLPGLLHVSG